MQIRKTLLVETMADKRSQKALAIIMLLKYRLGKTSVIKSASVRKIAEIAGVSPNTVKKYMPRWECMGLIEWQGANNDVLVIRRITSKTHHRNIPTDKLDFSTFKKLYESLKSLLFLFLTARKSYVERLLRTATNPKKGEDFKKARKLSEFYARREPDGTFRYKEHGLSFKKIGKSLDYSVKTAQKIVKKALKSKWCKKFTHFLHYLMPYVNKRYVEGFTFTTKNYGFVVGANTYTLSSYWCGILLDGKK